MKIYAAFHVNGTLIDLYVSLEALIVDWVGDRNNKKFENGVSIEVYYPGTAERVCKMGVFYKDPNSEIEVKSAKVGTIMVDSGGENKMMQHCLLVNPMNKTASF